MNLSSKTVRSAWLALSLSVGPMALLQAAGPAEVGTIIDLQGNAQAKPGGALAPLDFLTEGSTVELAPGGKMTVTLYKQGTEYAVTGPATFQVNALELKGIKGNPPALLPKASKPVVRNPTGAPERNAGAVIMRSVRSAEPAQPAAPVQSPTSTNGAQK
ncbi:hypothetical protein NQT62_14825 [Limnobacter humi]|uniref:DUF5666 domain-containing protein n=1 Tax=Limnobacter humi TaxID=1778671 RepID=A0ABT1WKR8_9BURK|nr:hypothetical protein [Limnobacter humi]MCQ8897713.1 hypothetical protein [Limnobacter humi]